MLVLKLAVKKTLFYCLVDVILDVEEQFDIVIDQQSMEEMVDIQSTIAIIETKLSEKQ